MVVTPRIQSHRLTLSLFGLTPIVLTILCSTTISAEPALVPSPSLVLSGDSVTLSLRDIAPLIDPSQMVEVDILDARQISYGDKVAKLYGAIASMCHVGSISPTVALLQNCAQTPNSQTDVWSSFIAELKQAAITKPLPSPRKVAQLIDTWRPILERFGIRIYLISSGTDLTPVTVDDLVRATLVAAPLGAPLNTTFSPTCSLDHTSLGSRVDKLCARSIPLPPFTAQIERDSVHLTRVTRERGRAFIKLWNRTPNKNGHAGETVRAIDIEEVPIAITTPQSQPSPLVAEARTNAANTCPSLKSITKLLAPGDATTTLDPIFGVRLADERKGITAILSAQGRLTEHSNGESETKRIRNLVSSRLHKDGSLELHFSPMVAGRFTAPLRENTTASLTVTALIRDEAGTIHLLTTIEDLSFRTASSGTPHSESITRHVFALSGHRREGPPPAGSSQEGRR